MVIVLMFTYVKVFHLLISIIGMVLLSMVNIRKTIYSEQRGRVTIMGEGVNIITLFSICTSTCKQSWAGEG